MKEILRINKLFFSYSKNIEVLSALNIEIISKTITAILGKNGCGKSTMLDCIIGIHNVPKNTIFIQGKEFHTLSQYERSKIIAYVPQNIITNLDFKVFDFILFGRNPHIQFGQKPTQNDYNEVLKCAQICGLTALLGKNINKISGGERQLASITRALVQNTPIIIMDEPMSALDFGNQAHVLQLILDLQQEGKTIIFTTHNPNHALTLQCNVAIMENKQIIQHGDYKTILNTNTLKKIYGNIIELDNLPHFHFRLTKK